MGYVDGAQWDNANVGFFSTAMGNSSRASGDVSTAIQTASGFTSTAQLLTKTIVHAGGSAAQTIKLSSTVSKGIYQLQVSNDETKKTQQIIVQ